MKKYLLAPLLTLALGLVAWYGSSRLLAPSRVVQVSEVAVGYKSPSTDGVLRVGTYNIAHARGGKFGASNWTGSSRSASEAHLERISLQVASAKLDILVVNEVDFQSSWSHSIDQARAIARGAGFGYVAEQRNLDVSLPFRSYRFGNAVLSRYPITGARVVRFPPFSQLETLLAGNHDGVVAEVDTPQGRLRVLAVHLEYRSAETRRQCVAMIEALTAEEESPLLAMGDYNAIPRFARSHETVREPDSAVDRLLDSGLLKTTRSQLDWSNFVTFPSEAPDRAIDWILASPTLELGPPVVVSSDLSDHLMVTTEIRWRKNP